jgi:outer membrane protein OmpA-like peptidoglycan-associated protein
MKRIYVLSFWLYFFVFNPIFAQNNLTGVWQGILTQPHETETLSHNYAFWFDFKQIGNLVSGHCRIEIAQTSNFAIIQFRGKIVDSVIQFQQFKITNKIIKENAHWCMITGILNYHPEDNSLRGTWKSISAGCTDGEIVVFKTDEQFNNNKAQTHNYTQLDTIKARLKKHQTVLDRKIVLNNIHFDSNKSTLKPISNKTLDELFALLQQFPKLRIRINGHTDAIGNDAHNLKLSIDRAKAVVHYLIEKGITPKRLTSQGFGESRPLAENTHEQGREENRRVEFEIVGQ